MPYPSNDALPDIIKSKYPDRCQTVWRETWNATYAKSNDEGQASRYAYTAANACQEARSMIAIRTVSETEDIHVIEGLGIPFGGPFPGNSDSYGTRATKDTDFAWDLYPDRTPSDPEDVAAQFTRPVTFIHGFDNEVGLSRMGGWSPMRQDKKGVWIRAQLDKRHAYYSAVRELLDSNSLGFSSSSAEHWADITSRGDWRKWPVLEIALTPTESNPWAQITARTASFAETLVRITARATDKSGKASGPDEGGKPREDIPAEDFAGKDKSYPIVTPASVKDAADSIGRAGADNYSSDELKSRIIAIAKRKGPEFEAALPDAWKSERSALRGGVASEDVATAASVLSQLAYLMDCESDEPDQVADLKTAFDAVQSFIGKESAEIGTEEDEPDHPPYVSTAPGTYASGWVIRQGKRNSTMDLGRIDAIHDHTVALGATAHVGSEAPTDESHQTPDAERSAEGQPIVRIKPTLERLDAETLQALMDRAAQIGSKVGSEIGADTVRSLKRP